MFFEYINVICKKKKNFHFFKNLYIFFNKIKIKNLKK
jgi:hypothetical protein